MQKWSKVTITDYNKQSLAANFGKVKNDGISLFVLSDSPGTSRPWSWMRGSCGELLAKRTNKYEKTAAEFAEFKETF